MVSDLNGFLSLFTGSSGALSYLILFLTIILLLFSLSLKFELPGLSMYLLALFMLWLALGSLILYTKFGLFDFDMIRKYIPSVLLLFLFSRLFVYYYRMKKFDYILNVITISLLLNVIMVIYSNYQGAFVLQRNSIDRSSGFIASVNQAGVTSVLAQVFFLFKFMSVSTKMNNFYIGCYFIALYATFLTFSKAAFLSSIIVGALFILTLNFSGDKNDLRKNLKWKKNKVKIFLGIPLIFLLSIFNIASFSFELTESQLERLLEFNFFLKGELNEETTTGRTHILKISFEEIFKDNLLGRGIGSFHNIDRLGGTGAHNEFILLLGEIGLIGLLFYLGYFLLSTYKAVLLKDGASKFFVLGMITVLFLVSLVSHSVLFIKSYIIIFSLINCILYLSSNRSQHSLS